MIRTFQPMKKRTALIGAAIVLAVAMLALPPVLAAGRSEGADPALQPVGALPAGREQVGAAAADGPDMSGARSGEAAAEVVREPGLADVEEEQAPELDVLITPAAGKLTSPFGYRVHPARQERELHDGIDIAGPAGTAVQAAAKGDVIEAAYDPVRGHYAVIRHSPTLQTEYRHLAELLVQEGASVEAGDRIGTMGSTGQSTGVHLHFAVLEDGSYIDPLSLLEF